MPNGGLLNLKLLPELPIKLCAENLHCSFTKDARSEDVKRLLLPPTTLERTHNCALQDSEKNSCRAETLDVDGPTPGGRQSNCAQMYWYA